MRARKKKYTNQRLQAVNSLIINDAASMAGSWSNVFENVNPLFIELGCGKGSFITNLAQQNPDKNYIAIEKLSDIIVMAVEKCASLNLKNLRFSVCDASLFTYIFSPDELSGIFINFCDPWPSKKHAKRRLVNFNFLEMYKRALKKGGFIQFKTDNRPLFNYAVDSFVQSNFKIQKLTYNLHNEMPENNIMTEYELKFSSQDIPINYLYAEKQ